MVRWFQWCVPSCGFCTCTKGPDLAATRARRLLALRCWRSRLRLRASPFGRRLRALATATAAKRLAAGPEAAYSVSLVCAHPLVQHNMCTAHSNAYGMALSQIEHGFAGHLLTGRSIGLPHYGKNQRGSGAQKNRGTNRAGHLFCQHHARCPRQPPKF